MMYKATADVWTGYRLSYHYKTKKEAVEGIQRELLNALPEGSRGCWTVQDAKRGLIVERGVLKK